MTPISLDEQISRCIIENRDETGAIDPSDQSAMKDEILKCFAGYIRSIELPENWLADPKYRNLAVDKDHGTDYFVALGHDKAKDCLPSPMLAEKIGKLNEN